MREMLTLRPFVYRARQLARLSVRQIESVAARIWQIAPPEETQRPKAFFLPGQFERIMRFSDFSTSPAEERRSVEGTARVFHGATRGFLLRDAIVANGAVYCGGAVDFQVERPGRVPLVWVGESHSHGALYSTFGGNRYFGQWLIDDLVTYHLAKNEGIPFRLQRVLSPHAVAYESLLDMSPISVSGARFRELVMFSDVGQNQSKGERFDRNRRRLTANYPKTNHPGVFLLRGRSGVRRVLENEMEIAHHLERTRGFLVVDVMASDVPTILRACAGAAVVTGIEGSHMVHALMVMGAGRALFTLQPPTRYCSILKDLTDRDGQHFAFVVGQTKGDDFHIDPDEVERTLDLLPLAGRSP